MLEKIKEWWAERRRLAMQRRADASDAQTEQESSASPSKIKDQQQLKSWLVQAGFSVVMVLFISYLLASVVNSLFVPSLIKAVVAPKSGGVVGAAKIALGEFNYRDVQKDVVGRNVFNADGKLPDEKEIDSEAEEVGAFDLNAPCTDSALPLSLVGTIFLDNGSSLAIIREKGFEDSDVYQENDLIIGQENASIAKIDRSHVVINNGGRKECLHIELVKRGLVDGDDFIEEEEREKEEVPSGDAAVSRVTVEGAFVLEQLGEGYARILQSARSVPTKAEDGSEGFKIFDIQAGSLLERVNIKNNDIVTQVNDTLLTADQGFALYEAFENNREVRLKILRGGREPHTVIVTIK